MFQALPIASICNGKLLCVHGGISQRIKSVKSINKVYRFREPLQKDILTDLLWADPFDNPKDAQTKDYAKNDARNISVFFGLRPVKELLKKEKLLTIVRAHQVKPNGYEFHHWEGNFPTVITIFSAPNYEKLGNSGAVLLSNSLGGFEVRIF